jgi:DNA ligase (NAD+)
MTRIVELKELITRYDTAYRSGNSVVPDNIYDDLVDELVSLIGETDDFFLSSIKEDVSSERRQPLPKEVVMASMGKSKTIEDLLNWERLKGFKNTKYIISPKYDGISICKEEKTLKAYTRGGKDNGGGLRSDEHLSAMNDITIDASFTFGEAIISKKNWEIVKTYFEGDSARNGCSGLFRRDYASDELQYVDFIRYGVVGKNFSTKQEMFDFLNKSQKVKVPYVVVDNLSDLTEEYLKDLYLKFSLDYTIDGLIIEVDDISLWKERERNGNPKWAVAFKSPNFEEVAETTCIDIENGISKDGNIIPVAILSPVKLDGAIVSRVTLNNYSFMKEMGIGIGSRVLVKRSGQVIPLITKVLDKKDFILPNFEGGVEWRGVHLATLLETDEQKIKKIYAFFNIIGVEGVSDKTFEQLYKSGFKTIKEILNMSQKDFSLLERFGERKSDNVYNAIQSKTKDIPLPVLQHATSLFKSLGKKKLVLLTNFETKPSIEEVVKIDGFSDILANNYLDSYDLFWEFIKDLPITYTKTKKVETVSNDLEGQTFVFTGFRDVSIESTIETRCGKIGSSVSKTTTYLIMKSVGSASSKETKALSLGVKVLDRDGLIELLNK